ncbi:F-box only protein 48 [Triplophysa tibetana]|uniref:F-box only protein 48 n=1 Tax=Triplophysa tibetana TaxID=1572043 RepID=A0A5A9PJQ2_9TELE|nr:F-box only protein 48 [Triplophysa tibetana]
MQNVYKRSHTLILGQEGGSTIHGHDQLKQNFVETLPTEMSVRIFSELDLRSLCRASLTCKHWNGIIEGNDFLWRNHCLTVHAICRRDVDGDRQNGYSWKVTLLRNYRKGCVKRRWLKGRYSNIHSADEIPPNHMCPLDTDTWGEILEAELER